MMEMSKMEVKASDTVRVEEAGGSLTGDSSGREWDVVIIKEGSGSSGDYSREVLERDVPGAFPVGTHVYIDHPTESEAYDRPERSVRDLAGIVVAESTWDEAEGGMRSRIRVTEQWAPLVEQMHEFIGLSIRAQAIVSPEANESGRYDIMSIVPWPTNSVDIVTLPGAGGRFVEAYESIRATMTTKDKTKEASVDLNDIQKVITEAIAPLIEAQKEPEASEVSDTVRRIVEADIPSAAKIQVAEAVDANPGIDVDKMIENISAITEAVRSEIAEAKAKTTEVEESADLRKGGARGKEELSLDGFRL